MIRRIAFASLLLAAPLGLIAAPGCSPPQGTNSPETFDHGSLDEVGDLYRSIAARANKPPASLKDLAVNRDKFMLGYNSIAQGDVIVYWGVTPIPGDQPTDEILGYRSDVPAKGGAVLLKNTTIKRMSAAEFQSAPKPSGPTSTPVPASAKPKA